MLQTGWYSNPELIRHSSQWINSRLIKGRWLGIIFQGADIFNLHIGNSVLELSFWRNGWHRFSRTSPSRKLSPLLGLNALILVLKDLPWTQKTCIPGLKSFSRPARPNSASPQRRVWGLIKPQADGPVGPLDVGPARPERAKTRQTGPILSPIGFCWGPDLSARV